VGDASVDMLVNNYSFDLVPFNQMDKIIGEFKRVLKRDGKLILINMTKSESLAVVSTKIFIVYHHVFWAGAAGSNDRFAHPAWILKSKLENIYSQMFFLQKSFLLLTNFNVKP
jgi:ubiquinone/menaquinone biosynthesis C-methylase UbiE